VTIRLRNSFCDIFGTVSNQRKQQYVKIRKLHAGMFRIVNPGCKDRISHYCFRPKLGYKCIIVSHQRGGLLKSDLFCCDGFGSEAATDNSLTRSEVQGEYRAVSMTGTLCVACLWDIYRFISGRLSLSNDAECAVGLQNNRDSWSEIGKTSAAQRRPDFGFRNPFEAHSPG
jgi:hypothetical protein